jgi:membrane-bound lytic murein transglycosylase A
LILLAIPLFFGACAEPGAPEPAVDSGLVLSADPAAAPRSLPSWATPPPAEAVPLADSRGLFAPGSAVNEIAWETHPYDNKPRRLVEGIDHQLRFLARSGREELSFGGGRVAKGRIIATLLGLRQLVIETWGSDSFHPRLAAEYRLFQSVGKTGIDDVLFTGYFLPVYRASAKRTDSFPVPLYARPEVRARRGRRASLPTHAEIDRGALKGRGLEVAWVASKLDRFFLQVQGSGILIYPDGKRLSARYGGGNGRQYTSIGRLLVEDGHIPREEISMQRIRQFFSRRPDLVDHYLHRCASFVFFRIDETPPLGVGAIPLTPDLSAATDARVFGTGLVGIGDYPRPHAAPETGPAPVTRALHFVLAQDAGGAIKGPGHIDIFTGEGDEAAIPAGFLNHTGRLFFIVCR